MKILFVRPKPSKETIGLQHVMIVEPLELEVLASLAGKEDSLAIADMIIEKKDISYFIRKEDPDIFCVTGYISNVPEMIGYCRTAKEINPQIVTIAGGVHCEVCPGDLDNEFIDFRVVRNATVTFPALLNYIKGFSASPVGVLKPGETKDEAKLPDFDFTFPLPDRSITARYRKKYFYILHDRVALIKTAFGCPFSCNFCFCREITGKRYHERPANEVIEELKTIREKNIYIVDDDFLVSRKRVEDFIRLIKINNIDKKYLIYGRADFIAHNPDLIKQFHDIGLRTVIVGFESFFDEELALYNKDISARTNEEAMAVLNKNNIDCYATIILPPWWGEEEFDYCRDKIRSLGIHYVNLQPLTPLPCTGQVINNDELLIPYSDYAKWDLAHITIRPRKLSVADFYRNILKLYNSILLQPRFLLGYIIRSKIKMIIKMIIGSYRVSAQYKRKIKEAENHA